MSCTWPTGVLTSRPSSTHLTNDQANSLYKLAAECQAIGVKLAKKFQVLLELEAMHCNRFPDNECEATPAASAQRLMSLGRRCMK